MGENKGLPTAPVFIKKGDAFSCVEAAHENSFRNRTERGIETPSLDALRCYSRVRILSVASSVPGGGCSETAWTSQKTT